MATASNQDQLNEVVDELVLRVQDALKAALGTIDVGDAQALGFLSTVDDLASAPVGNAAAVRTAIGFVSAALTEMQKYGVGSQGQPDYPLADLSSDPSNIPSGFYRVTTGTAGKPGGLGVVLLGRYNNDSTNMLYIENSADRPKVAVKVYREGVWSSWLTLSVEIGSNANGVYMKFGGVGICLSNELSVSISNASGSIYRKDVGDVPYPMEFDTSLIQPVGFGASSSTVLLWVNARTAGATRWSPSVWSSGVLTNVTFRVGAIGLV